MTARPKKNLRSRRLSLLLPVLVAGLLLAAWAGCATPHERYRTLSFFFDGVPNPDAPRHIAQAAATPDDSTTRPVLTLSIVSRHKPYVDRQCAACHNSASGNIMEFEEAYKACTRCHKKITTEYPRMHGPVAAAVVAGPVPTCKWCHAPHESTEPALLKDTPVKVCTQCHDAQLLAPKPQQHTDGTSCIQCHFGHGSAAENTHFVKPNVMGQWSTSRPSTRAATQPGTRPTTPPATRPAILLGSATNPDPPARGVNP